MTAKAANETLVTVFGGSGFVGRHVVRALAKRGYRLRVATRRPDLAGHLQPMGAVGQIQAVQANLRYPQSVAAAVAGADAVINLVGILYETGRQSFNAVHAQGAAEVAGQAKAAGAGRLVHMSALATDPDAASDYARSKAAAEAAVLETFPSAVIFRPSVIFGPEDKFFNTFAALARLSPVLPLIGGGKTLFEPVFVGDVAEAVALAVDGRVRGGIYELGGPEQMSLADVFAYVCEVTERKRLLVPLPFAIAKVQAAFLQMLPNPLLTIDQVRLLANDVVVGDAAKAEARTLSGLGIKARPVHSIVPEYLQRFRRTGEFKFTEA
ncbi:NAD-dependent epimerase/dehydratase [hydrothermal vent metagenome]|uniref:NAD-dependent epimerase/dehydratase n=1 Tax=hydrothermal vent metagenome TaxID=652676 RepID=A0A3B0TAG5_9ZZZZ